jgi:hypothetical protein
MTKLKFKFNDGGRSAAGYKGNTGDCVVRAIAIAAQLPYQEVYDELKKRNAEFAATKRSKVARKLKKQGSTPRNGNFRDVYEPYLKELGFHWVPTMKVGQGCQVHMRADELPKGRIVCSVSKHLCAVIDHEVNDTYSETRNGSRCVYGYYIRFGDMVADAVEREIAQYKGAA